MADVTRILVAGPLPPMTLHATRRHRIGADDSLSRVGRLAWLLTALCLPVLGLTFADLVHRAGRQGTLQAAVPMIPSAGAAAPSGVTRADAVVRVTPAFLRRDGRA